MLREFSFSVIKEGNFACKSVTNVEAILGLLYFTSFCSKRLLGKNVQNFENDLKQALYKINPEGVFEEDLTGDYIICKK